MPCLAFTFVQSALCLFYSLVSYHQFLLYFLGIFLTFQNFINIVWIQSIIYRPKTEMQHFWIANKSKIKTLFLCCKKEKIFIIWHLYYSVDNVNIMCYGRALLPSIICLGRLRIASEYIFSLWQLRQGVDSLAQSIGFLSGRTGFDSHVRRGNFFSYASFLCCDYHVVRWGLVRDWTLYAENGFKSS